MPTYKIHRMREAQRQNFRFAPHVSGTASVKPKDYEHDGEVEAESEYDAWARLRGTGLELQVGDLLETPTGELRICKYVGFEAAEWVLPEPKQPMQAQPAAPDVPAGTQPQA